MSEQRVTLSRTMSKMDVFGLSFGAMIGWGWVVFASDWLRMGGTAGASIAFVIGALMCVVVSLVYAELTSALPVAGGPVAFTLRGLGETWSWVVGWTMTLAYISVAAFESVAVTAAIDFILPIPKVFPLWTISGATVHLSWVIVGALLSVGITYLNLRGTKLSVVAQAIGTAVLLGSGILFLTISFGKGSPANMQPVWTSVSGTAAVLMMVPFMMVGFDVIPQSAEEANIPHRIVGGLLTLSVVAATAWYLGIVLGLGYAVPATVRNSSQLAVCTAVEVLCSSPFWGKILAVGGVSGILTSWNAFLLAASRVLFSMGRAKMLPQSVARLHPVRGTPTRAILVVGAVCTIAPFLGPRALTWFANVGGLCTCVTYLIVAASFVKLRYSEPGLERPFRAGKTPYIGVVALIITSLFISLYLPIGPSSLIWPYEWAIVGLWVIAGIWCFGVSRRANGSVTKQERKYLMFGESLGATTTSPNSAREEQPSG